MSKRKVRIGRHRPPIGFDPGVDRVAIDIERYWDPMPIKFVVDEVSDLHACDFLIPPLNIGESVIVTHSDRPEKNGVWILAEWLGIQLVKRNTTEDMDRAMRLYRDYDARGIVRFIESRKRRVPSSPV
jgi:hypothetical protein